MAREVVCVTCGKMFTATHSQTKYCPDACRQLSLRKSWNKYTDKNKDKRKFYHDKYYCKNYEKIIKRTSAYHKTVRGKEASKRNAITQKILNPEKIKARRLLRSAIEKGIIIREKCEHCGLDKVHGHHDDYTKPLKVRWLCIKHHAEYHRRKRANLAVLNH